MTTKQLKPTWKVKLRSSFKKPILIRRIVGDSMMPGLEKDRLIIATGLRRVKASDVVIANVSDREVIKRVKKTQPDKVWLEGDNQKASTDSRKYGWIDKRAILGVVIYPLR